MVASQLLRRRGFTLVELLVVIGIIALLVSILLPALSKVRWNAQIVTCSARMRDLTQSVLMYASANKGYLPPYAGQESPSWNMNYESSINSAYQMAYRSTTVFAESDPGALFGRLYRTNFLKDYRVIYCPSTRSTPDKMEARWFNGTYVLNPHVAYQDDVASPRILQTWWKKIDGYGKVPSERMKYIDQRTYTPAMKTVPIFRRALITESMYAATPSDRSNVSHTYRSSRAYNFAYPDGSVITYTATHATARQINSWVRFLDLSNALQHAIDGGAVNWRSAWQNNYYNAIPVAP